MVGVEVWVGLARLLSTEGRPGRPVVHVAVGSALRLTSSALRSPIAGATPTEDFGRIALFVVAIGCAVATFVWARSARRLARASRRLEALEAQRPEGRVSSEAILLARATRDKDLHTALLYGILAFSALATAVLGRTVLALPFFLVLVPVAISLRYGRRFLDAARLGEVRSLLERRAEEVLEQDELAPLRWSARLAPSELPAIEGFQLGHVYQPGTGAMAGDFYDVAETGAGRLAAVIGDVTGHGIEPSITAFQVKYLLRIFLREYRDPAQALEELNAVLCDEARSEELVSLCAVVFDPVAATLRYTSAGHPAAWLWHDGDVRPLRSTGPLLALDPHATYFSKEVPLDRGDVLLLYTDGLAEARSGETLFGEERVAAALRRDPHQEPDALCKGLLAAAQDFASTPLPDDVAILAVRRE